MSMMEHEAHYFAQRCTLTERERNFVDNCLAFLEDNAKMMGVPLAQDDRLASLEAAFNRLVITSRVAEK